MTNQKPGTRFYRHYKNKPYKFLAIARHSETLEEMALYESLYENPLGRLWVRPKEMFFEDIEIDGKYRPRFEKINFIFKSAESLNEDELLKIKEVYGHCFLKEFNRDWFDSKLQTHKNFLFLMAFDNTKLVAFKFGYAEGAEVFYSWIAAVLPDYQKLGLGTELARRQQEWCQNKNYKKIETRIQNKHIEMLKLSLNAGFKVIGTQNEFGHDIEIILQKTLE